MRIIFVFFLFLLSCSLFISAEDYTYTSIENLTEQEVGRIVLPEIYRKLNLEIAILPMPAKRAQSEAASGHADGEIMRIYTYGEENPTLCRVPTPCYFLETTAFVKKGSGIVIEKKEDLKKYRVVKVSGVKHTDNITRGMTSDITDIGSTSQMMLFLNAGRADVALTNTSDGLKALHDLGLVDIIPAGNPLAVWDLYHYIHKKHRHLVPEVDNIIRKMKASGELVQLIKRAEAIVLQEPGSGLFQWKPSFQGESPF